MVTRGRACIALLAQENEQSYPLALDTFLQHFLFWGIHLLNVSSLWRFRENICYRLASMNFFLKKKKKYLCIMLNLNNSGKHNCTQSMGQNMSDLSTFWPPRSRCPGTINKCCCDIQTQFTFFRNTFFLILKQMCIHCKTFREHSQQKQQQQILPVIYHLEMTTVNTLRVFCCFSRHKIKIYL